MDIEQTIIILAGLACWYAVRFYLAVRKKGLDPTLLTYFSPVTMGSYWVARLLLGFALLTSLLYGHSNFVAAALLISALIQLLLLAAFERLGTQPWAYISILAFESALLLTGRLEASAAVLALAVSAEVYLYFWRKTQSKRYNRWVAKKALKIHHQFSATRGSLTDREWFHVLHIATTEHIARPKIVRIGEYIYFHLKRPAMMSTGIMQVMAARPLSDPESFEAGTKLAVQGLRSLPSEVTNLREQLIWLGRHYNGSGNYSRYLLHTYRGVHQAWASIQQG